MNSFELFMSGYYGDDRTEIKNEDLVRQLQELKEIYNRKREKEWGNQRNIKLELSYFETKVIKQALKLYYYHIDVVRFKDKQLIERQFKEIERVIDTLGKIEQNICFESKKEDRHKEAEVNIESITDEDLPF